MVDIFVGAERKQFHLHHDLLCDRSDYFKACFEGDFKEAEQKELFLPEDDIESFGLFVIQFQRRAFCVLYTVRLG